MEAGLEEGRGVWIWGGEESGEAGALRGMWAYRDIFLSGDVGGFYPVYMRSGWIEWWLALTVILNVTLHV